MKNKNSETKTLELPIITILIICNNNTILKWLINQQTIAIDNNNMPMIKPSGIQTIHTLNHTINKICKCNSLPKERFMLKA